MGRCSIHKLKSPFHANSALFAITLHNPDKNESIQYAQGNYPDAINNLSRAADIFQYLQQPLGQAQALNYLGDVYQAQGESETALNTYNQALIAYAYL